ncbi:Nicotinamide/nicotinic acid mononucleotide adenylyltransferase [Golovinomyces cichoracearum]|uniref:Nicotinamide-nucleotide adenylyltransferase n=1 Tax=Golovinomyces cichoracearum TaxID=62708 RepID=A0A420J3K7_9PEZI|nr:Nicotinamide/nicotinic acid mononucleotide adenylyltransferase [Golovinomyces cichoracearum]
MSTNNSTQLISTSSVDTYTFPHDRLRFVQNDPTRVPLVLVACGSFSPITYLHLRMFMLSRDFAKFYTNFELMGGYISPVSDSYKKSGLVEANHRLKMCQLAVSEAPNWLMVDPWEAVQSKYIPTARVLDHFEFEINQALGGAQRPDGTSVPMKIALLAGADLIQTMITPGIWSECDLAHILGQYGLFIIERSGTDLENALAGLERWKENIYVVQQLIHNDVSSTKIRLFLKRDMSVEYLIPAAVIKYIEENGLYEDTATSSDPHAKCVSKGKSNC